jgi:hypothetical protein
MIDSATCESELRRVKHGPEADEHIPGIGTVRFLVLCKDDAQSVLQLAKAVMEAVAGECASGWREAADWHAILPMRFVKACADEMTQDEAEAEMQRRRTLSQAERAAEERERRWSLANWLYWLAPSERAWQWWDAQLIDNNVIAVAVAVESWPFAWGALAWLFRGSGAVAVEAET